MMFTSRYVSKQPSWLTSCHGECDATGFVPVHKKHLGEDDLLTELWLEAERFHHSDDEWHFVKCPDCNGTAKVSTLVSLTRVPNWIYRGIKFVLKQKNDKPEWHTKKQHYKNLLWAAFGADLKHL